MIAQFRDTVENYFHDNWSKCPVVYESADAKPTGEFIQLYLTPLTGSNICRSGNELSIDIDMRIVAYSDTRYNTDVLIDKVVSFIKDSPFIRKNDIVFEANGSMNANMWFGAVSFTFTVDKG